MSRSILPFPSFLDDVREKGLKKAVLEGIDETVERITAGMNIQDIREALRGDAPSRRPNPRLSPHADGFWLHMRPGYFHQDMTGIYPTFRLGWLSTYFVVFETITGMLLMFWYTPSPEIAYGNMLKILNNVPLGQFMRDMHRLGAEAMVLIVALHMMRTWVTGSFKKPRQFTWFTGVLLLLFTGLLSFTGYLLPWDQLSLWAVTIGASMGEATPVIGEQVNLILRGAPELGANGLLRFYLAHVFMFPLILFIFLGVHYYKVIIHAHSLPPQAENIGEDTAKRVPLDKRVYYIPDILTNELMWAGVTTLIIVVLCVWFYHAPLENHADPQNTPLGTTAPWYFLWIQGALKLGDKVFWGLIFPGLVVGGLAVLPYIDVTPSRRYAHRRISLTLAMGLVAFMTIISYMGLPEFGVNAAAETEILHELTMEPAHNHVGKMRVVPFAQLAPGGYTTLELESDDPRATIDEFNEELANRQIYDPLNNIFITEYDFIKNRLVTLDHLDQNALPTQFRVTPDDAPVMREVLEEFTHKLEESGQALENARGLVVVTEYQAGLKRVDMAIVWDGVELVNNYPVKDENGNLKPLYYKDTLGRPILFQVDAEGNYVVDAGNKPTIAYKLDDAGNPMKDADGNPVYDEAGKPIQQRLIFAQHIYLHKDSAYFD